ncbi:MAG: hypothetical protein K2H85_03060, partial [Allobaculum sp.]|nr:hypothetical protein [Allobaculum sp.]
MLNKKRLAMIAVAASMVLPNNLVYLATNTPVFAADEEPMTDEDSTQGPTLIDDKSLTTSTAGLKVLKFEKDGEYILDSSLNIGYVYVPVGVSVTLDMNGNNITTSYGVSVFVWGNLTLKGTGEENKNTITSTCSDTGSYILDFAKDSTLTAEGVTFKATNSGVYGMGFFSSTYNQSNSNRGKNKVTLTDVNIDTKEFAITVNGLMTEEDQPTITLNNVNITSESTAIYQAGSSKITVENSVISSKVCGIETRAGTLEVSKTIVNGGIEDSTTVVKSNKNGTTTENAGIAISQHSTKKDIKVTIEDSKVNGSTGLAIVNPEGNSSTDLEKIEVELKSSVLTGSKDKGYDLAYQVDKIKSFSAQNVTLAHDENPERVEIENDVLVLDTEKGISEFFKLTTQETTTPTVLEGSEGILNNSSLYNKNEDTGEITLTPTGIQNVKTTLETQINDNSKNNATFRAYSSEASSDDYFSDNNA